MNLQGGTDLQIEASQVNAHAIDFVTSPLVLWRPYLSLNGLLRHAEMRSICPQLHSNPPSAIGNFQICYKSNPMHAWKVRSVQSTYISILIMFSFSKVQSWKAVVKHLCSFVRKVNVACAGPKLGSPLNVIPRAIGW